MLFSKHAKKRSVDEIKLDSQVVSLTSLEKAAKKAGRRFWALMLSAALISTMIVPYLSLAATVADQDSDVFTGTVIPGYSMGGLKVAAYGVDLNSWAKVSSNKVVATNYGIWSDERASNAQQYAKDELKTTVATYNMDSADKSRGWSAITNRTNYSLNHPNGSERLSQSNQYDNVAPYRTLADYNYWNSKVPTSSDSTSADIEVSLYADFVAISVENGKPVLLRSPDDENANVSGRLFTSTTSNAAIPYYVSLKDLCKAYGLTDTKGRKAATMSNLMDAISAQPEILAKTAVDNNLVDVLNFNSKATYKDNNAGSGATTTAFNPYPYSMVFTCTEGTSKVVSSIYDNSEAYVYFSPASVYNQYLALKAEYNALLEKSSSKLNRETPDPATVFQCGYYLAEMSILEAYLEEALPQDMTRGYVGPSEAPAVYSDKPTPGWGKSAASGWLGGNDKEDPAMFQRVSYSTLMYDVASALVSQGVNGSSYKLADTNAIMDTLSTFGYSLGADTKPGVMQGMTRGQAFARTTAFTPYDQNAANNREPDGAGLTAKVNSTSGMYTAPYYPIQAHKMPALEKTYRFQVISSVPYQTLVAYLADVGFVGSATLSYSSGALDSINTTTSNVFAVKSSEEASSLASALDSLDSSSTNMFLDASNEILAGGQKRSIALNDKGSGFTAEELAGLGSTTVATQTAARVDSALLNYQASAMNADNVHDMLDIVRSTGLLKYETWYRFYNPNKTDGMDGDLFLTRVSPALTTYMPAILINGYTAAGGDEVDASLSTQNCSFDYYCPPSFSPCFASHCSDDCYYGSLNYELRPFYSAGFTSSISSSAGIPAVEKYEQGKSATVNSDAAAGFDATSEIATLYVMAKRLAFITTATNMRFDNAYDGELFGDVSETVVYTDPVTYKMADQFKFKKASSPEEAVVLLPLDGSNDQAFRVKTDAEKKANPAMEPLAKDDMDASCFVVAEPDLHPINLDPATWGTTDYTNVRDGWGKPGWAIATARNLTRTGWGANNSYKPLFSFYNYLYNSTFFLMSDPDNRIYGADGKPAEFNENTLFRIKYDQTLNALLNEGGEFYWMNKYQLRALVASGRLTPDIPEEYGAYNPNVEYYLHGVSFDGGIKNFGDTGAVSFANPSEITSVYRATIAEATKGLTDGVNALIKDRYAADQLPTQMQNCLGWATDQNASVSEQSYQADPTEANVIINLNSDGSAAANQVNGTIFSLSSLAKYDCRFDPNTGKILPAWNVAGATSMNSRMTRGVEGTTYLATTQPSCYSISATVQRVSSLTLNSGVAYPYSGLCNGRLSSGTNKYATLESHTIDYTSLENGVSGDLALKQSSRVVKLSNLEYAGVSDFVNLIGNAGAFFGELGSSMLSASSDMFSTAFFSTESSKSTANAAGGAAPLGTRASASNYVFNKQTGTLDAVDTSSSNASAANQTASVDGWATSVLLDKGYAFYALLQCFGLAIVMISLMVIAFRNFYAYSVGTKEGGQNIIAAQTQLKVVVPRAIISIFMIGLPPLSASSTGFQGGAFLLCQALSKVISHVANIFTNLDGAGIMSVWQFGQSALGSDIFSFFAYLVAATVISAMFILGAICIIIQSLCLIAFYLTGPIVWALYLWPYSISNAPKSSSKNPIVGVTEKLKLGPITGGKVGNAAPAGWVAGYVSTAVLTVAWSMLFWVVSMLFAGSTGLAGSTASAVGGTAPLQTTGYATASASLLDAGMFGNGAGSALFSVLFMTVIAVLVFMLMWKLMKGVFMGTASATVNVAQTVGASILAGARSTGASVKGKAPADSAISDLPGDPRLAAATGAEATRQRMEEAQKRQAMVDAERSRQGSTVPANAPRLVLQGVDLPELSAATLAALGASAMGIAGTEKDVRLLSKEIADTQEALTLANALRSVPASSRAGILRAASPAARFRLQDAGLIDENGNIVSSALESGEAENVLNSTMESYQNLLDQTTSNMLGGNAAGEAPLEAQIADVDATVPAGSSAALAAGLLGGAIASQALASSVYAGSEENVSALAKELSAAGLASPGALNQLNALNENYLPQIEQLELNDVQSVEMLAGAMALGYADLFRADGQSVGDAMVSANNLLAEQLSMNGANLAKLAYKGYGVGNKGGVNMLLAQGVGKSLGSRAYPAAVSPNVLPLNLLSAAETMDKVAVEKEAGKNMLLAVRPDTDVNRVQNDKETLMAAREMLDIVRITTSKELVGAFVKAVMETLPKELAENNEVSYLFSDISEKNNTIQGALTDLVKPDMRKAHAELRDLEYNRVIAATSDFFESDAMITNPDIKRIMMPIWANNGLDPDLVFGQLEHAMVTAQFSMPACLVDSNDISNKIAAELVDRGVLVSDFVYMVFKEATAPMTVNYAQAEVMKLVDDKYDELDVACKREDLLGVNDFMQERTKVREIEKILKSQNKNFVHDTVFAILKEDTDMYPTPAEAEKGAFELEHIRAISSSLSTPEYLDAVRFHDDPRLVTVELVKLLSAGFSLIVQDEGKALPAMPPVKALGSVEDTGLLVEKEFSSLVEPGTTISKHLCPDAVDLKISPLVDNVHANHPELFDGTGSIPALNAAIEGELEELRRKTDEIAVRFGFESTASLVGTGPLYDKFHSKAVQLFGTEDFDLFNTATMEKVVVELLGVDESEAPEKARALIVQISRYRQVMSNPLTCSYMLDAVKPAEAVRQLTEELRRSLDGKKALSAAGRADFPE